MKQISMHNLLWREESTSNCCGAPIHQEQIRCSDCLEHCSVIKQCKECGGQGVVPYIFKYLTRTCKECEGEGEILINKNF